MPATGPNTEGATVAAGRTTTMAGARLSRASMKTNLLAKAYTTRMVALMTPSPPPSATMEKIKKTMAPSPTT